MKRHASGWGLMVALGLIAWQAGSARAGLLVNWGPSAAYVSATQNLVLPTPTATQSTVSGTTFYTNTYGYSSSVALTPASGYTPPAGMSGTFYGGSWITATSASNRLWSTAGVVDATPADYIRYFRGNTGTVAFSGAAFTSFLKPDFLNGGSSSTVAFDLNSSISLAVNNTLNVTFYLAVEDGSQWYISQTNRASVGTLSLSGSALLTSKWAAWDPTGGLNGRLADVPTSFTISGSSFTDLQGFGVYEGFTANAAQLQGGFSSFTVNAVPEPSSLALLALCGVGLGGRKWLGRRAGLLYANNSGRA